MRTVAIILARGGSKGLPRKNVQTVGGIPLIVRTIQAAQSAELINAVYVSTDDTKIKRLACGAGARVIQRPPELATETSLTCRAVYHALDTIAAMGQPVERLVVLQCTSPFTTADDIDGAVLQFDEAEDERVDCLLSVMEDHHQVIRRDPSTDVGVQWITVDRFAADTRRQDMEPAYCLNGAIGIYNAADYRRAGISIYGRVRLFEMPQERSIEIDTPADLVCARALATYHTDWIVIGASPSARESLLAARLAVPNAVTIATNGAEALFSGSSGPDYYHIHDMNACVDYNARGKEFQAMGTRLVTLERSESSLKKRGLDHFDEFVPLSSREYPGRFKMGEYSSCGLSGLMCIQYALNHGAKTVHIVGQEGYGKGDQYFHAEPGAGTQDDKLSHDKRERLTLSLLQPYIQGCIDVCPAVQFVVYGNLEYKLSGENVKCVA